LQANIQELKDHSANKENTCESKSMRGVDHLPVVDPLDGAADSEGLAPPNNFQAMDTSSEASEERLEVPSDEEICERFDVCFQDSENGPWSSGRGAILTRPTKAVAVAVRRLVIKKFKVRRPQVRQSPTAMLDMEEAGAYLLADLIGLPVIPKKDARDAGFDIRIGGGDTWKNEIADAKKEAGRLAGRRKLDQQDRKAFVEDAALRVGREDPQLRLPSLKRCVAVAAAAKPTPTAKTPTPAADWKQRGWRLVEPPLPRERPPTEIDLFLSEDFEGEEQEAKAKVRSVKVLLGAAKNKVVRAEKAMQKMGEQPSPQYLLGTDLKGKMPESVRDKRECDLLRWEVARQRLLAAAEELFIVREDVEAAEDGLGEAHAKCQLQQRIRDEQEAARRALEEKKKVEEAALVERVRLYARMGVHKRLQDQSMARVEELDAQLAELHVAMAAAEAVEGHNGEMSDGEDMALESVHPLW
jgi:hypothetical protein